MAHGRWVVDHQVDETPGAELVQRLADRRATDPEQVCDLRLVQPRPGRDRPVDDGGSQDLGDVAVLGGGRKALAQVDAHVHAIVALIVI